MDFNQLKQIAEAVSKHANDNERIAVPLFSGKLARAAEKYPSDYTIGMIRNVIARMEGSKQLFISRAEIKELYNKLHSRNTQFSSVFAEELGENPNDLKGSKTYDRSQINDNVDPVKAIQEKLIDPVLASALSGLFGKRSLPVNDGMVEKAKTACQVMTAGIELKKTFAMITADDGIILCRASFETPKGETSVLIPVEFEGQDGLLPQVFIGNDGPTELTTANLTQYVLKNAGKKLEANPAIVIRAAMNAKNSDIGQINEVDLALTKLNATRETSAQFAAPSVLGQKLDEEKTNLVVKMPEFKDDEITSFAKEFDTALGIANFTFKPAVVSAARNMVVQAAKNFGLGNPQINVCDGTTNDTLFFAVSANAGRIAFKVPVKIASGGRPMHPVVMISGGMPSEFSKTSIDKLLSSNSVDYKLAAVASPNYALKSSELVGLVKEACTEGNLAKAEDALNVLNDKGDAKAYNIAFAIYSGSLSDDGAIVKTANEIKCSMIVKSANSQHELCGHTGLPLHKTYVDKHGNCLPGYRKQMSESNDGAAYMMNSKIFF